MGGIGWEMGEEERGDARGGTGMGEGEDREERF